VGLALLTAIQGSTAIAGSARTTEAQVSAISWGPCSDPYLRHGGAQCGFLAVPLNHANPGGRQIKLAVSRVKATAKASARQGPLVLNPGGPGGAGRYLSAFAAQALPHRIARTYDLIGFDPRGVGDSRPALHCLSGYAKGPRPDFVPRTGKGQAPGPNEIRWLKRSKRYADACATKNRALLPFLRTEDAARDLDVLRRALGAEQINYYGFSYGTYLGEVYATLFPTRTRRLIFDGVVTPSEVWYTGQLNQDRAFQGAIAEFWTWVARHADTYRLGRTAAQVSRRYLADQQALRRRPVQNIGPDEWADVFLDAGYYQVTWPDVAGAWAAWARGNHAPLRKLYADDTADFDNGFGMYLAVQCTDAAWPHDYADWRRDAFATARRAPFYTWDNVWYNTPCIYWGAPSGTPVAVNGQQTPELLLVNSTLDGATPFASAREVRALFPHSALVAQVGSTSHADSLNGNPCVDGAVFRYLRTGKLPARHAGSGADLRCRRTPLPQPA
jgi:pimeloyl-ACP methyl ester carboxylesterase